MEPASSSMGGHLAGRPVHRIGYGVMQLAERAGRPTPDVADGVALLRRAVELGVDHIDTVEFYGDGVANDMIRTALHSYPDGRAKAAATPCRASSRCATRARSAASV